MAVDFMEFSTDGGASWTQIDLEPQASHPVAAFGNLTAGRRKYPRLLLRVHRDDFPLNAINYSAELSFVGAVAGYSVQSVLGWNPAGGTHPNPFRDLTLAAGVAQLEFPAYTLFFDPAATGSQEDNLTIVIKDAGGTPLGTFIITAQVSVDPLRNVSMVMVLDRSGSMSALVGSETRANRLRAAAGICKTLMRPNDRLGVVTFNHDAYDTLSPGAISNAAHSTALNNLFSLVSPSTDLDPSGSTSIGDGVFNANGMLTGEAAGNDKSILVFTDGIQNTPRDLAHPDVTPLLTTDVYAIGLGDASSVSIADLDTLTSSGSNPRYVLITGDITGDQQFKLEKYFTQILIDVKNDAIIVDPEATISAGEQHAWPFSLTDADLGLEAILITDHPELLDFDLIRPDGQVIDNATANQLPTGSYTLGQRIALFRFESPQMPGAWKARIRMDKAVFKRGKKPTPMRYAFMVAATSDLRLQADVRTTGVNVGANLLVSASVTEGGLGLEKLTSVAAALRQPNGTVVKLSLKEMGGGVYAGSALTLMSGLHTVRVVASGNDIHGRKFTREATRTAFVLPAGKVPHTGLGPVPPNERPQQPGGGTPGTGVPPRGSLDELFERFPDLKKLLERCCGHDHHDHGDHHHGHGRCHHGHGRCDCCCHHR